MIDEKELEWIEYLIGKRQEEDLSDENKARLEDERAVRQGRILLGDVPLKDWDPTE